MDPSEAKLMDSGAPKWVFRIFRSKTFLSSHSEEVKHNLKTYLDNLDTMRRDGIGLAFMGKPGTGKTGLMGWVFSRVIDQCGAGEWMSQVRLLDLVKWRENYDEDTTWRERLIEVPVLALDRITPPTDKTQVLWELLDDRAAEKNITFLTFQDSVNLKKIEESYLELVKSLAYPIMLNGKSLRVARADKIAEMFE